MTYIMYIDESYDSRTQYVVLLGFIIADSNWRLIDRKFRKLKEDIIGTPDYNIKDIRTSSRTKDAWFHLSKGKKDKFSERFYKIVLDEENTIICSLIDKTKIKDRDKKFQFKLAYSFLLQRFQYFLQENDDYGFIVMDKAEFSIEVKELYDYHLKLMREGIPVKQKIIKKKINDRMVLVKDYERLDPDLVYENLFFDDDKKNSLLQISDMAASGISAKYNHGTDRWMKKLIKIIRKSPTGKIEGWGLKIFPETKSDSKTQVNPP